MMRTRHPTSGAAWSGPRHSARVSRARIKSFVRFVLQVEREDEKTYTRLAPSERISESDQRRVDRERERQENDQDQAEPDRRHAHLRR